MLDIYDQDSKQVHLRNRSKCTGKMEHNSLCSMFRLLDADFFSDAKVPTPNCLRTLLYRYCWFIHVKFNSSSWFMFLQMLEIEKGATKLNLPIIKSNRESVALINGGLENPSSLVFTSSWSHDHIQGASKRFNYPSLSGVERPKSDEGIAFMSISCSVYLLIDRISHSAFSHSWDLLNQIHELGRLIKSKQITSVELAQIFLNRLKRYMTYLIASNLHECCDCLVF